MMNPNPKNYEFIWLVENQDFLSTSVWVNIEYPKYDFIFTYYNGHFKTYLSKKDFEKLSNIGYNLLSNRFLAYKNKVKKILQRSNISFRSAKRKSLSQYSNKELREVFLKFIQFIQELWSIYFYTEYFCFRKVELMQKSEKGKKVKLLLKRVKEMQKIKLQIRRQLNRTWFLNKKNVLLPFYREIKRRIHIDNIRDYHYQELADILVGKKIARKNRQIFVWGKFNRWKPITGKRAMSLIKRFDNYFTKKKELVGQVANIGYYVGRVKIIPFDLKGNIQKKITEMKKGDVLVTGSTGPEMILACKKAGAIVTEEGGITSHAAIISRELKIPCVIGTKIATQVLKDGDKIEVDAFKGIVRKL